MVLLLKLMNLFELEDNEQREFYAVDLRHHRELFCARQKGRKDITITSLTNVINVPQLKITTILM